MILVDSSAWVEYDRATNSPTDRALTQLIEAGGAEIAVTEPTLMEVLAGARNGDAAAKLRRLLTSFEWIPVEAIADFEGAATIYRTCRRAGITPRGLIDCMIANIAMRTGSEILAADADFTAMSGVMPLRIHTAKL